MAVQKPQAAGKSSVAGEMVVPFESYLEQHDLTLPDFSKLFGLPENNVLTLMTEHPSLSLIGNILYTRTTLYSKNWTFSSKSKATSLRHYVKAQHKNNPSAFAKLIGESAKFVQTAISDDAYWVDGEIFMMVVDQSSWVALPLTDHIKNVCDRNTAAFSRAYQMTQQQMDRWVKRDCMFCRGEIYLRRTELQAKPAKDTNATLVRDHIRDKYGSIEDGIRLFSEDHNLNPQQVRRYISYDALWILGDVYKNQSKFSEQNIDPDFSLSFKQRKPHVRKSKSKA
jgi:hypothetical protein